MQDHIVEEIKQKNKSRVPASRVKPRHHNKHGHMGGLGFNIAHNDLTKTNQKQIMSNPMNVLNLGDIDSFHKQREESARDFHQQKEEFDRDLRKFLSQKMLPYPAYLKQYKKKEK